MGSGFYGSTDWHKVRAQVRKRDGYKCVWCRADVKGNGTSRVDHIVPLKLAPERALDLSNLQTLCIKCHESVKKRDENSPARGTNLDGTPKDPDHPWSKL